jgi:hypothetical protein
MGELICVPVTPNFSWVERVAELVLCSSEHLTEVRC